MRVLVLVVLAGCFTKPDPPGSLPGGGSGNGPHRLAANGRHGCWIDDGAQLWCWGDDRYGELGDGATTPPTGIPQRVGAVTGWTDIAAGDKHTCGVLGDVVECFGADDENQTQGSAAINDTFIEGGAVRVFAGDAGTCATNPAGQLYCWGHLDDKTGAPPAPMQITPARIDGGWIDVAIGYDHSCALHDDGQLYCWGANPNQQLGTADTTARRFVEAQLVPGGSYLAVGVSDNVSCGIDSNHSLVCWGSSDLTTSIVPTAYSVIDDSILTHRRWTALAVTGDHLCAVADGSVYCYGDDDRGSLGHGDFAGDRDPPGPPLLQDAVEVRVGDGISCVTNDSGEVRCWGQNRFGELGNREVAQQRDTATPVALPAGTIHSVTAGYRHTCASVGVMNDVYCWGDNRARQSYNSTDRYITAPDSTKRANTGIQLLAAGANHTCGITNDAQDVLCWGDNSSKQAPADVSSGSAIDHIAAGGDTTCMRVSGDVSCWGNVPGKGQVAVTKVTPAGANAVNDIAVGTTQEQPVGAYVDSPGSGMFDLFAFGTACYSPGVMPASIGAYNVSTGNLPELMLSQGGDGHGCILQPDPPFKLYCFGAFDKGQTTGTDCSATLVTPPGNNGWSTSLWFVTGGNHTCALDGDEQLYCWGDNADAAMGELIDIGGNMPPQLANNKTWSQLAAGPHHTCGVDMNNQLYCWGWNQFGELGNGRRWLDAPPTDPISFQ